MFIAMNRFRVKRGAEGAFEKVWLSRDSYLDRVPGFVEFHLLKGARGRRPYALCLPYSVADQSRLRGMDQIGGVPRCARARRQRCDRATLSGASQIRGLRSTTDRNSQGGGRVTRFRALRLALWHYRRQRLIARKDTETDVAVEGRLSQTSTSNGATTRSIRRNGPTAILNGRDLNTLKIGANRMRDRVFKAERSNGVIGDPAVRTLWICWSGVSPRSGKDEDRVHWFRKHGNRDCSMHLEVGA
jgi:hypothetical protein